MSQGRPTVELRELGTFVVREPAMAGYEEVLAALPPAAYDELHNVVVIAWHAPDGTFKVLPPDDPGFAEHDERRSAIMADMLPHVTAIIRVMPRVLSALVAACLRRADADSTKLVPVDVDAVHHGLVPSADVPALIAVLLEENILGSILSAVKNLTAPARKEGTAGQ